MVQVIDAKSETVRAGVEAHVHDEVDVILTDDYRAYPIALKAYKSRPRTLIAAADTTSPAAMVRFIRTRWSLHSRYSSAA
jgi:hypothetical protein